MSLREGQVTVALQAAAAAGMVGATLAQYRIAAPLGSGGSGVVYRAFDTRLRRTVAIKLLHANADERALARLVREARAASALNHPNICTIHEVGQLDGQPYIVMEEVDGSPLGRVIPPGDGLPLADALSYAAQIADGLAHAHARGIVHRDLKSANVMVTPDGRLKILDFGLARKVPDSEQTDTATSSASAAEVAGTPLYMAPETLRGQPADPSADIWALGVLLYEMVAGERPFAGATAYEVTSAVLRDAPAPLPGRVPASLAAVIARCLAKDPEARYARADDVKAALLSVSLADVPFGWFHGIRARQAAAAAILAATVALADLGLGRWRSTHATLQAEVIAVVPQIVAAGPDVNYLSDGITEDVINGLSRSGATRVIALASAMRYKAGDADPQRIRRELHATKLVTVRVAQLPESMSISAELMDLGDGSHIWGERFDTNATNLVSIASAITAAVADNLKLRLPASERRLLTKRYTENIDAYQAYLRGRESWYKSSFGPEGYRQSLQYYQQAIAKDPSYALAYTGIADTYVSLAFDGWTPTPEALALAIDAANKALAIDPNLGEAHYSLACIEEGRWNFAAAAREYVRAIELSPNSAHILRFHALFLFIDGSRDAALAEMKRSLDVDPLGLETNKAMAASLRWAGRPEEAIAQARRTLELDPDFAPVHQLLADLYDETGRHDQAVTELQRVMALAGDPEGAEAFGREYEHQGYDAAIRSLNANILEQLNQIRTAGWISPIALALASTKTGDLDAAFKWLGQAYEERAAWLIFAKVDPDFTPLRSDPRFQALAARVGLP